MNAVKSSERYLSEAVARLLRRYRQEAGIKQEDVAGSLRKPQSYVSKVESGERRVDLVELIQLLRLYRRSLVEFETELKRFIGAESGGEEERPGAA